MMSSYFTPLETDPALTLLSTVVLASIVFLLILLVIEAPRKLLTAVALLTALLHAIYTIAYARIYNLELHLKPLLDIYVDSRGYASATIDVAQLIVIALAASHARDIYTKLREKYIKATHT
ncbi:hypothetical protein [Hyperthermus butylicus]|uniref:Uncharacterized protein n=1 Tax=Hyperthermus butylicus (strain DSM 5456 / JCM 9403 / PLM1-5) TaxID=415426 RepID=A2BN49_HYPBU|nr:hypothetical protein [Hyperthermus butylicus]ABM81410.1 hypothetical protein Hbut_1591 [Hyperthermus butylicus DSM 5456]